MSEPEYFSRAQVRSILEALGYFADPGSANFVSARMVPGPKGLFLSMADSSMIERETLVRLLAEYWGIDEGAVDRAVASVSDA